MDNLAKVSKLIFLFVFVYFLYRGITTIPWEGDSLAYHIPIARNILKLNFSNFSSPLFYYPASVEALLAIFMWFRIPLNLFNVLSWVLLFAVLKKLAKIFGLDKNLATIFAVSICLLPSVIRLMPTQTVDIWLAVFWLWSLVILAKPQINFVYLGLSLGLLIGSKYSGPLFVLPLLLVYSFKIIKSLSVKNLILFTVTITLTGLSWYLRNWVVTGNPIYPTGALGFQLLNWQLWKTPLLLSNGTFLLIQALISEYLIWAIVPAISLKSQFSSLKFFGWANLAICMLLPTWPENIISDLRYTYVAFMPLILLVFLYFQKRGWSEKISLVATLTMISVIPQLDYYPKLFVVFGIGLLVFITLGAPSRN